MVQRCKVWALWSDFWGLSCRYVGFGILGCDLRGLGFDFDLRNLDFEVQDLELKVWNLEFRM